MTQQKRVLVATAAVVVLCLGWAYWPTLVEMVATWSREPDYSHGFLVVPFAGFLLWNRRASFPGIPERLAWGGAALIAASGLLRLLAARFYLQSLDGYTIPVWMAGVCWLIGGRGLLVWAWPAIVFLIFMVPLPWRVEHLLSVPMQQFASRGSCWLLQCLGQPAVAIGNTIMVGDIPLEVEQACSGLRLFVGFFAVSFAYVFLVERPLWQTLTIVLAAAPIAVVCNVIRITTTGLLYRYIGGGVAQRFTHDAAGWTMILLATALLASLLWYLNRLVIEVQPVSSLSLTERVGASD